MNLGIIALLGRSGQRLSAAALLLAVAIFAGSCGALSQDESCAAYSSSVCGFLNRCNPLFFSLAYGDITTCTARYKLQCGNIFAMGTSATPTDLKSCGDAVASFACGSIDLPAECRPKPGALANGSACINDSQCQGTYCQSSGTATSAPGCGTCGVRAPLGASCSNATCDYGLACSPSSGGSSVCSTPSTVGVGATCGGSVLCQSGTACVSNKCVTTLKLGDACGTAGTTCDQVSGLTCDSTSMKCTATPFAKAGQSCGTTGPQILCAAGARCTQMGAGYVCVAPAADGAACDISKGIGCQEPAACVSGSCTLPQAAACK